MKERNTAAVQATETSFAVLEVLREHRGAGVSEVARALDIPKSTAHKHLTTLATLGYATNEDGTYDVGLPLVGFGQYARGSDPLFRAAQPAVEHLAETTEEITGFFVERGGRGFDVYRSETTCDAVHALPRDLHSTAPGKAILAALPDETVDTIVERHGLVARTEQTITRREALDEERARIRERGIAFDREESGEGVHGVAVPVTDDGSVRGAVYVIGNRKRLTGKWFDENIPGMILSAVNGVEQRLREH